MAEYQYSSSSWQPCSDLLWLDTTQEMTILGSFDDFSAMKCSAQFRSSDNWGVPQSLEIAYPIQNSTKKMSVFKLANSFKPFAFCIIFMIK